jgi:TPR repeat protein
MAHRGNAYAQYELGEMYGHGDWRRTSKFACVEAAKWYRKAAEQGHARAQYEFGRMCAKGEGVGQSNREAVKWFRLAAEQGDVLAQQALGKAYRSGRGVEADLKQTTELLTVCEGEYLKFFRRKEEDLPGLRMVLE